MIACLVLQRTVADTRSDGWGAVLSDKGETMNNDTYEVCQAAREYGTIFHDEFLQ